MPCAARPRRISRTPVERRARSSEELSVSLRAFGLRLRLRLLRLRLRLLRLRLLRLRLMVQVFSCLEALCFRVLSASLRIGNDMLEFAINILQH